MYVVSDQTLILTATFGLLWLMAEQIAEIF